MPYAKSRPELSDLGEGEITQLVLDSDAWTEVMVPILDKLDAKDVGRNKPGPRRSYSAHELESVLLFQRICGLNTYKEARDRLASDRHGQTRKLLGFDLPRQTPSKVIKLTQGIPSESTVSRHRSRFGEKRRHGTYERLFARLVELHLEDEDMKAEARIIDLDGSHVLTHFRSAKSDKSGKPGKVTCADGGWVPPSKSSPWRTHGHGFNLVSLTTSTGLPLAKRITKIQKSERRAARELFEQSYARTIKPSLGGHGLSVLSADGGLHSPKLRRAVRKLGVVENIHLASHGGSDKSLANVAKRDATRIPIEGYSDWFANGHRELICKCGKGSVSRIFKDHAGRAVTRAEGRCKSCGSITITSGAWYLAANVHGAGKPEFRRCQPGDEDRADLAFGNALTFNDPLSSIYGSGRFGHQEGFHGHLVTRFGILREKGWYRRKVQAETDVTVTFCVMHVVAMEYRRRLREADALPVEPPANGPPVLAAVA